MTKQTKPKNLSLNITVVPLGEGFLAFGVIGGVRVAGDRRDTAYDATCSLFSVLAGASGDNSAAAIAIEMLLAGMNIDDLPQLGGGS